MVSAQCSGDPAKSKVASSCASFPVSVQPLPVGWQGSPMWWPAGQVQLDLEGALHSAGASIAAFALHLGIKLHDIIICTSSHRAGADLLWDSWP